MQIGIFVSATAELSFKFKEPDLTLDKLEKDGFTSQPLALKMKLAPGVYRIETDMERVKTEPHAGVVVLYDADFPATIPTTGEKTPFPPDPPPGSVTLVASIMGTGTTEAKLRIQKFLTSDRVEPDVPGEGFVVPNL